MQLVTVAVASREAGLQALEHLDDAVSDGLVSVEDAALVYKNAKGKVKIHQTRDATAGVGAIGGGGLGLLVGIVAAPPALAATAVGAGAGALIGKARDRGISDKLMKQIGTLIDGDEAAVFVMADDSSSAVITTMLEMAMAEGAQIDYETIPPEGQDFLREAIKLAGTG